MFKRLPFALLTILISSVGIISCNNDEPSGPAPSLTLSDSRLDSDFNYTANKGDNITITVKVTAPGGFNVLRISYTGVTLDTEEVIRSEDNQTNLDYDYLLEDIQFEGEPFTITFLAVDNDNQTTSQDVIVGPEDPSISFPESENTNIENDTLLVSALETVTLGVQVSAGAGFVKYTAEMPNPNGGFIFQRERTELPPTQGNSFIDRIEITIPTEFEGDILQINFTVDDEFGQQGSAQLPVKVLAPDVKELGVVLLQAPLDDRSSKTFYSTLDGERYSSQDVIDTNGLSARIDFGYYYGQTDDASLASPNAYPISIYNLTAGGQNWATLNLTSMAKTDLTEGQYLELTSPQDLIDTYEQYKDQASPSLTQLAKGDIITFKTKAQGDEANKFGLIMVGDIIAGSDETGQISLEIRVIR